MDELWLISAGVCLLALISGVIPLVGGVNCGACVLFSKALGVFGCSGLGVFVAVRGCCGTTECEFFRTSWLQFSVSGSRAMVVEAIVLES